MKYKKNGRYLIFCINFFFNFTMTYRPKTNLVTSRNFLLYSIFKFQRYLRQNIYFYSMLILIILASMGSPYYGVDIPVRVAVTETINAKFIGVGNDNTKIVTNAEIFLGTNINNRNQQIIIFKLYRRKVLFYAYFSNVLIFLTNSVTFSRISLFLADFRICLAMRKLTVTWNR